MPTAIWKARLRSGSAHCDLEVAVEVRQCPLGSGARGGGPAVPTGIWSSRWRSGCAHWNLDCEEEAAGEEAVGGAGGGGGDRALLKSSNPHLAGGEKLKKRVLISKEHHIYEKENCHCAFLCCAGYIPHLPGEGC